MTESKPTIADESPANELEQTRRMLAAMARIQELFLNGEDASQAFDALLDAILGLTDSQYGFIGEVLRDDDGAPYLKTRAITNIAWDDATREFFARNAPAGLEFRNLDTLFGAAMRTRQVVIANDPASDTRSGGLPRGHPPLDSFAGIPFLQGERLVGMVGVANRPGGYSNELLGTIAPLLDTMRTLIVAHRAERERAKAQEGLRASEAEHRKLATVASLTSNIVFVTDSRGEIDWVNDAFVRITGYSLEEARGRTPMDLLHGPLTDRTQVKRMSELLARGQPVTGFEIANYAKNGQPYWVAIEIQPVRDARGEIVQYVAIESDVSAAREAEREWRASQARFVAAFHGASDYQVITRIADGVFIEVNAAALELSGFTREQMLGRTANDLGLWADPSQRVELQARLNRDGHVSGFPCTLRNSAGGLRECLMSASRIEIDTEPCQLTRVHDVTEIRRAERTIRENEQRLRALFDSAVDATVVIDERGTIEAVNPACERMFGYAAHELVGANVSMLMPEPDRSAHDGHLARHRASGQRRVVGTGREVLAQRRNGEVFAAELAVAEIVESRGRRFSGTIRDVSARRQAEEAANRLNRELHASVAALEQINSDNEVLSELRDLLQACHAVDEAVRVSAQFAMRLLDGACGAIYLLDPGRGLLEQSTLWGGAQQSEDVFGKDDCWSLRRGRPFFGTGGEHGLCCAHVKRMPRNGYACVPLAAQGETFGLMHMQCDVDSDAPAHGDAPAQSGGYAGRRRHIAGTIAEYLSLAIANVRMRESLRRQATRDALTGLYNRRQMDEILDREIRRAARHQRELVLMMIDIDHFKRINDVHGHEVGDLVLREVAQCIQRQVRDEDYAFRYGGEEFLLLLPDANPEQIGVRGETILEAVRHLRLSWMGQPLDRVSVSLGVAAFPAHGHNAADLVRAADGALLKAKAAGRDRLETASASVLAQLELGTRIGAIV